MNIEHISGVLKLEDLRFEREDCEETMAATSTFPRGGKRVVESQQSKQDEDLFKLEGEKHKKKKKGKKTKVSRKPDTHVQAMTFEALREGTVVLGRVKDVQEFKVMVSLPHGLLGTLHVTAVSQAYTQRLREVAEADDDAEVDEQLPTLKDLFTMGEGIACKVVSVKSQDKKRFVDLTSDPSAVNRDLPVNALRKGSVLFGAVRSVEDHGMSIDIGVPGIQAFLPTDQASDQAGHLTVGKCVWCKVDSENSLDVMTGETRVIRVSMLNILEAETMAQAISSVDCLHPGMKVKATVERVLKNGINIRIQKFKGCVHKAHLPQDVKFSAEQEIEGRVLYIHPLSKVVSLSLLPGIMNCVQPTEIPFGGYSIGELAEVEVSFVAQGSDVYFKLEGSLAMAPHHHLSDEKIKDVHQAFPAGSRHKCRVIGFKPADDVVVISLKQSVMKQKIVSIKDIQPGQIMECTVEAFHDSGIIVLLGKGLTGIIPKLHVADIPVKQFSKKFKLGQQLKCRVLKVDADRKKVSLSHKKSLVCSSSVVPASYDEVRPGMQLEGYIIAVKDNGVVVCFCNDVKGWVPRLELSTVEILHPETAFQKGQVVRCLVTSCQPEHQKMRLSFVISGKASIGTDAPKMEGIEVGKLMEAKVTKKLEKNVELELLPSGAKALLPLEHLADSMENQLLLCRALKVGDRLDCVMLLKQTNVTIVTLKESFLSAARAGLIPKSSADVQVGQLLPAVIRNHQTYGIFVELPGGLRGLVLQKFATNHRVADLTQLFVSGQSVVVKILEVKEDKDRFLCSLRMSDCFQGNPNIGVEMLETFLNERDNYLDAVLDHKVEGVRTGKVVQVTIKDISDGGYVCETDIGMTAVAPQFSGEAELGVGSTVEGVVLNVAVRSHGSFLQLSLNTWLVKAIQRRSGKPTMDKARPRQVIKGQVVMVTEDFVLVALKQHAAGMLAWMPKKQHPNDVQAEVTHNLAVGEEIKVFIKKCSGDRVLAILSTQAQDEEEHPSHTLQLGDVVTAQVQSVLPGQINIMIEGKVRARIHLTEILDNDQVTPGVYPVGKFKKGQEVMAKIIGFRHYKNFKYLPISHPRIDKAMPECTLKPSKLERKGCPTEDQASHTRKFEAGQQVVAYVTKFENNKLWVSLTSTQSGVISIFDLSKDLGVLKYAQRKFAAGHAYPATVLGVEEEGLVHLTLTGKKEAVKKNQVVTGKVTSISNKGLALRLPGDFRGLVPLSEESGTSWSNIVQGSFIRCLVLCCKDKENCLLSLNLKHRSEEDLQKIQKELKGKVLARKTTKRKHSKSEPQNGLQSPSSSPPVKKRARRSSESEDARAAGKTAAMKTEEKMEAEEGGRLEVGADFVWDQLVAPPSTKTAAQDSEEEDMEEDVKEPAKKKKKNKKVLKEAGALSIKAGGEQDQEFERRLVTEPNNSKLWIEYMCQQITQGKLDKARSIGNQALQTIAFEEEQEKMNIWTALLNLENMHGSPEEVDRVIERALKVTDPLKLYRRVASIFTTCGKMEEAEKIHMTMRRKFKQDKQMWTDYAYFLFKQGRLEPARTLLHQALKSLPQREHVATITKFATLEGKFGDPERSTTMLEKTITEFPKRSDVMSVYIDLVVGQGNKDRARELFERALKTMANAAKIFYKKYLLFEEKHGTPESLERLKQRIAEEL